jgi:transposase InsO family protein
MILALLDEAVAAGAQLDRACETLDLSARTVQRWRGRGGGDLRCGPKREPANKLSEAERRQIVHIANSPAYRDLSPKQIVPQLADQGRYIASESSFYRVLHEHDLMHHREPSRPPTACRPRERVATGPWQVASWDITYLKTNVAGMFYYLYMVVDVWSRKILGWAVHAEELMDHAAALIDGIAAGAGCELEGWVLHADNGGPMKGATMLATLQRLGVISSFSRPRVSDDNPFSEALFRTMKYRPAYPSNGFASLDQARAWVARFVAWYNTDHLHSGISYVTPHDRHAGHDVAILTQRRRVYERARRRHPSRWSRTPRAWNRTEVVRLNPHDNKEVMNNNQVAA